jgi:hypothetical protein
MLGGKKCLSCGGEGNYDKLSNRVSYIAFCGTGVRWFLKNVSPFLFYRSHARVSQVRKLEKLQLVQLHRPKFQLEIMFRRLIWNLNGLPQEGQLVISFLLFCFLPSFL